MALDATYIWGFSRTIRSVSVSVSVSWWVLTKPSTARQATGLATVPADLSSECCDIPRRTLAKKQLRELLLEAVWSVLESKTLMECEHLSNGCNTEC